MPPRDALAPLLLACATLAVACEGERAAPACEGDAVGARSAASSAPDRRLLGAGVDYPGDPALEGRLGELVRSQRARRAAAWDAVARVLAPVALSEPTPLGETSVPRFRTFLDREDFSRIFQHLYEGLTPEERAARSRFATERVDDAFLWNVAFLDELGTWPDDRWDAYVASFDAPDRVNAIGGLRRISISPALTRHLVESYPEVLRCLAEGAPPAEVGVGELRTDRLVRAPIELASCDEARFGPYFVARDATLHAAIDGVVSGDARLAILEGASPDDAETRCESDAGDTGCDAEGPGVFHVVVHATASATLTAALDVSRTDVASPVACLDGALPLDAVSIAAEWRRLDDTMPLATYDTSASALSALIAADEPTWGEGQGIATPGPDAIYTQRLPGGETFVLAGFHVRTRELPTGLYVTLWWSDRPDEDFGADRPDSIRALGPPWSSYKMCVAIEHTELDDDPHGGFAEDAPTLGAALAAVHEGRGGPTWCSNPYVDAAPGLARGNCVGCHQHAMSGVRPGEVATDPVRFPSSGRLSERDNRPSDGFWGLDAGDDLAALMQEVVDYWR